MHNQLENNYVFHVFIAIQRWILTAHDRAKILQTCREMADMYDAAASKHYKYVSAPRMKKDDNDVHKAMADRGLFARMVVIAHHRQMNTQ